MYHPSSQQTQEIAIPPKSPCYSKFAKQWFAEQQTKWRIKENTSISASSFLSMRLLILVQSLRILSIFSSELEGHCFPYGLL